MSLASWPASPRQVFVLALLVRLSMVVLTEWRPVFPAYFEADASEHHRVAVRMLADWREGRTATPTLSPAKRVYDYWLAALYQVTGPHALCARAVNAVFAAWAVLLLHRLALLFLPPVDAGRFGLFLALWPSYVYFGGGNTKDSLVFLIIAGTVYAYLSFLRTGGRPRLVVVAALLVVMGLLKTHFVLAVAAGLALPTALLAALPPAGQRARPLLALGAVLLAGGLYRPAAHAVLGSWLKAPAALSSQGETELEFSLQTHPLPGEEDGRDTEDDSLVHRIQRFRDSRQYWSQRHALATQGRRIETQILPGARLDGWGDLLLFIPRSAFQALFMPLPGLYELGGKLGRRLSAVENLGLLALFALALIRLARDAWPREALVPAGLFIVLAAVSGPFEFDLGSAMRHKPEFLPFILLFAFKTLSRGGRAPSRGAGLGHAHRA